MENGSSMDTNDTQGREDDRKLFVGGLSWDTYENDLKEYFGNYGEVENVNLKKDPYTQKSRGFAFVLFKSIEPLDKVLDGSSHVIKGKKVDPKRAKTRTGKIFVGGLNAEMTDDDIKSHFAQYGKIVEVEMPFDKQKNQRKGFCFITFEHEDMMKDVLKEPKQTISGKQVDVKKATPRPEVGGFGMPGARGAPRGGSGGGGFRGTMGGRGGRGGIRGRGGFQGGWDQYSGYGGYGSNYGDYSGGYGYDGYGGYGGYDSGYGYTGGYGGMGYGGGGKVQRGRGNMRQQPY